MSRAKRKEPPPQPPANPEEVCQRLIPPQYWDDIIAALGTSIELVHQSRPDRWGIRLAPDSIMLKIGPHEVLQIHSWEWERPFHLIIDKNSVPPEVRGWPELAFSEDWNCYGNHEAVGYYPSNPGSEACDMPFEMVKDAYQALLKAHAEVIARAATKRRNPSTLRAHSPELVRFVTKVLGKSLPQPAYFDASDQNPLPLLAEELSGDERFSEGASVVLSTMARIAPPVACPLRSGMDPRQRESFMCTITFRYQRLGSSMKSIQSETFVLFVQTVMWLFMPQSQRAPLSR